MARVGLFEPQPVVAVGVSGGADSMALALLLHRWLQDCGGRLLAITVDHALRPESAVEAQQVADWLTARGIAHRILRWDGIKPRTGIQEAARSARHRLLAAACREQGILHLALAHHGDDQAETVLMRLARGSGIDGLAGMPVVRHARDVRIIRPLLGFTHERLRATCKAAGQPWIEDPSNRDERYDRARLRSRTDTLAALGVTHGQLMASAKRAGRSRQALDLATADLLATTVDLLPEGWLRMQLGPMHAVAPDIAHRALSCCLTAIGAQGYPPRDDAVRQLWRKLGSGNGFTRTLASCLIYMRRDFVAIMREPTAVQGPLELCGPRPILWDNRFRIALRKGIADIESIFPLTVRALGEDGWKLVRSAPSSTDSKLDHAGDLPGPVRLTLPSIWQKNRLLAVPLGGFSADGWSGVVQTNFTPLRPLVRSVFPVV